MCTHTLFHTRLLRPLKLHQQKESKYWRHLCQNLCRLNKTEWLQLQGREHTNTYMHARPVRVQGLMFNVLLILASAVLTIISHTRTHTHTTLHAFKAKASSLVSRVCVNQIRVLHQYNKPHMWWCQISFILAWTCSGQQGKLLYKCMCAYW